jgi:hypothetical protein
MVLDIFKLEIPGPDRLRTGAPECTGTMVVPGMHTNGMDLHVSFSQLAAVYPPKIHVFVSAHPLPIRKV